MQRFCCVIAILILASGGVDSTWGQVPANPYLPAGPSQGNPYFPPNQPAAPQAPDNPLAAKSYDGLSVSLKIESADAVLKNELDVEITFSHTAVQSASGNPSFFGYRPHRILNPAMSQLLPLPGDFVIRDAEGKEVNRIGDRLGGSSRRAGEEDYVSLHSNQATGTKVRIYTARNPLHNESIKPGEYTLQFELFPAALGAKAERNTPVARSEQVKFLIGNPVTDQPQIKVARQVKRNPRKFLEVTLQFARETTAAGPPTFENEMDVVVTHAAYAEGVTTPPIVFVIRNLAGKEVNRYPRLQIGSVSRDLDGYSKLPHNAFIRTKMRIDVAPLVFSDERLPDGEYTLEVVSGSDSKTETTLSAPIKFRLAKQPK
jgi:hypothetical protein